MAGPLQCKKPAEIQKTIFRAVAIINVAAMLAIILKSEIHVVRANLKKMLYAKNSVDWLKYRKTGFRSKAIFNNSTMSVTILKEKVD